MPPFGPRGAETSRIANSAAPANNSLARLPPSCSSARLPLQAKYRRLPGRDVQVEAARQQVVALARIGGGPDLIDELPLTAREIRERKPHITLALVRSVVDRRQEPLAGGALPREGHETIAGPVAVPRGDALEQSPLALAHDRLAQRGGEAIVESPDLFVGGLVRSPAEMGRDPLLSSLELALMKESQPRAEERDDRRGLVHLRRERRRCSRLVVVFQEAGQLVLVAEFGVEVLAHGPGLTGMEAIVEPLVVCVVEALLLQRPLEVPVDLGHEAEVRHSLPHALRRLRPE